MLYMWKQNWSCHTAFKVEQLIHNCTVYILMVPLSNVGSCVPPVKYVSETNVPCWQNTWSEVPVCVISCALYKRAKTLKSFYRHSGTHNFYILSMCKCCWWFFPTSHWYLLSNLWESPYSLKRTRVYRLFQHSWFTHQRRTRIFACSA